jgi:hypothetical protein
MRATSREDEKDELSAETSKPEGAVTVIPVVRLDPERVKLLAVVGVWIVEAKAELSTGATNVREGALLTAKV